MKIPFKFLPASWGLKGKTREIAEAEYNLEGYPLEMKLAEINHRGDHKAVNIATLNIQKKYSEISEHDYLLNIASATLGGVDLECERLRIKWQFNEITELEYRTGVVKLTVKEGVDQELEMNEVNLDLGVIEQREFDKIKATLMNEPYVAVINSTFKPEDKLDGLYFEFDWNDLWITELKQAGYQGFTDDQIVQRWFEDLCRGVVADSQEDDGQPIPFNSGRIINQVRKDGGPTEYS